MAPTTSEPGEAADRFTGVSALYMEEKSVFVFQISGLDASVSTTGILALCHEM